MRIAYLVAYDGTMFNGFIGSRNSVFDHVINAFRKVLGTDPKSITFSSRTDPGVSALKNVIAFDTPRIVRPEEVNSNLPKYLRVWAYSIVPDNFSARRAVERVYLYFKIYEGEDIDLIRQASRLFVGIHDFSNFMIIEDNEDTVTEIYSIDIEKEDSFIVFRFSGKGFRNKMIRKIVWTLIMIGKRLIDIDYVKKLVNVEIRKTVPSAPAEGLILVDVRYDLDIEFNVSTRALLEFLEYLKHRYLILSSLLASCTYMIDVVSSRLVRQYFLNKLL